MVQQVVKPPLSPPPGVTELAYIWAEQSGEAEENREDPKPLFLPNSVISKQVGISELSC